MNLGQEIAKAIGEHGIWKVRLNAAIDSGRVDFDIPKVCRDDVCAFGQWLHGATITAAMRDSVEYIAVVQLHAQFHRCTARMLEYVNRGTKARAKAMMAANGECTAISSQLVGAMVRWKESIE